MELPTPEEFKAQGQGQRLMENCACGLIIIAEMIGGRLSLQKGDKSVLILDSDNPAEVARRIFAFIVECGKG